MAGAARPALFAAYLVAVGWVSYRDIRIDHRAPQPRTIIKGSALYALIGVVQPLIGDQVAAALGWGLLAATIITDLNRQGGGPASSLPGLLDPNGGKVPNATTPPPGSPPGTPPYLWDLLPGVPDAGSRPRVGVSFLPYTGPRGRLISL